MPKRALNKRHVAGVVIIATIVVATVAFFLTAGKDLLAFFTDGDQLQAWVASKGLFAPLAMILLVAAQVTIAFLPGEPVELGAGYAFGFWQGTLLCLIGGLVGTIVIIALVRTLGMRIVYLFFSPEKVASMKWLQDSARFEVLMFTCFLIPASPKDIMTYLAGLTRCPAWRICLIATVGRIPSIVSSTLAAGFAASGMWGGRPSSSASSRWRSRLRAARRTPWSCVGRRRGTRRPATPLQMTARRRARFGRSAAPATRTMRDSSAVPTRYDAGSDSLRIHGLFAAAFRAMLIL